MAESISLSSTTKGKTCIMDKNNHCYHLNNYKEGYTHKSWLCTVKGCKARLRTTVDFKLVGEIPEIHNHFNNQVLKRAATTMENDVIKRMAAMPGVTLKNVLTEISSNLEVRIRC